MNDDEDMERMIRLAAGAHVAEPEMARYLEGGCAEGRSVLIRGHLERCALCSERASVMRVILGGSRAEDDVGIEEVMIAASGGRSGGGAQREVPIWEHRPFQGYDSSLYHLAGKNRYLFSIRSLEESLKGKRVRIRINEGNGKDKTIEEECSTDSRRLAIYYDGEIGPGARVHISVGGLEDGV